LVISRNTAFTYRNKPIDTKQIGRELGVRYVVEGSVRQSGGHVRVSAQLIDAVTDAHLWAERFDRDTGDLVALQSEITSRLASALGIELIAAEAARPTNQPDALDHILRGRAELGKPASRATYGEAIGQFERALALDPQSVEAQSRLANMLSARVIAGWAATTAADIARAEELAAQALAASPRWVVAHWAKAQVLRAQRRFGDAIPEYETVLASNSNMVGALHALAQCKIYTGAIDEAIPLAERAIRLSPRDPDLDLFYLDIGEVHLLQSRIDEAIVWLEQARNANPELPAAHRWLASAYGLKGDIERAASELAEARRLGNAVSSIAKERPWWSAVVTKIRALVEATYLPGLRKAGVPEE